MTVRDWADAIAIRAEVQMRQARERTVDEAVSGGHHRGQTWIGIAVVIGVSP